MKNARSTQGAINHKLAGEFCCAIEAAAITYSNSEMPSRTLDIHFHKLAGLDPAARATYLAAHCPDDAMRRELLALLAADQDTHTGVGDLLARQAHRTVGVALTPGMPLGPYRVRDKIADGGMGSVYRGERADGEFAQQVALKVLRQVLPTAAAVERFRRERQLLAGLEHPGIARLLDGGTTDGGLPYLVMELVEGQPIDRYCDAQGLSVRQRLIVFQKVCAAVQAAHQSLVIHRDIKPANILVDSNGQPKLLDFGIAKLLEDDVGSENTRTGQYLMTPEYAAPEQIRGQRVGTTTDVYALGVLLNKLLTGETPYARWRGQPLALQKAICEIEPTRPSHQQEAGRSRHHKAALRRVGSDLDHIVLKALRKEPAERYGSPEALAEDLERYLHGIPVHARAGSRWYFAQKFLLRNRIALSITAAVVLFIGGLVGFYTLRLDAERLLAREQQSRSDQVSGFMVSLFELADPERNNPDITAAEILSAGAARVERELTDQPAVAARLLITIGETQFSLGQFAEALESQETALQLVRGLRNSPPDLLVDALLAVGTIQYHLENWEPAESALNEAVEIAAREIGPASAPHIKAINLQSHAATRRHRRDPEIHEQLQWAIAQQEKLAELDPWQLSSSYLTLGGWYKLNYRYEEAMKAQIHHHEIEQAHLGEGHRRLLWFDENIGRLHWRLGNYAQAVTHFERSLAKQAQLKGPRSGESGWSWYFLAINQHLRGQYSEAGRAFQNLLLVEENGIAYGNGRYLSRALAAHANFLIDMDEFGRAEALLTRAQAVLDEGVGADSVQHFHVAFGRARLREQKSDWPHAVEAWRHYVDLRKRELAPEAPQIALGELRLAHALQVEGALEEAGRLITSALPRLRAILGDQHPEYGIGLGVRGRYRIAMGNSAGGLADLEAALDCMPAAQINNQDAADVLRAYLAAVDPRGDSAGQAANRERLAAIAVSTRKAAAEGA